MIVTSRVLIASWIFWDARKRGKIGIIAAVWFSFAFIISAILTLVLWFIFRPKQYSEWAKGTAVSKPWEPKGDFSNLVRQDDEDTAEDDW